MDDGDRIAFGQVSLPLWEPKPKRSQHKMATTNSLTPAELNIAKLLGITAEKFAAQKVAQHTRENSVGSNEDETRTIFQALGIRQEELPHARMTRDSASGDKQLSENLIDLIQNIDLASNTHLERNGSPSISLMCASQLARDLQARFNGANKDGGDQGDDSAGDKAHGDRPMLSRTASHARMPGAHKAR
jgi:hypothetical protein